MKPVWVLIVVSLMSTISFAAENVVPSKPCGLRGITHFVVRSGIPGGPTTGGPDSVEFAIAPLLDDHPQYRNAIFVKSDPQGKYEVALPPGRYWVGPRAKALDPENYKPAAVTVSEEVVVVRDGFTELDLVAIGYAP